MAQTASRYLAHIRALLRLGLPLVGSQIALFSLHLMDTIMLGWYSVTALAAATLAGGFWFVFFIVGAGFGNAVLPVVAEASAAGDEARVRRFVRMAIWLSVLYGLIVVPLLWFSGAILTALDQPPEVVAQTQTYLRIAAFGLFGALIANVVRSFLGAMYRTTVQLVITLGALVAKVFLNWVLIFGNLGMPEMGITGAAITSSVLEWCFALAFSIYAARTMPQFTLFSRLWRPDWKAFGEVFRLGLPIGMTSFAEVMMFESALILMGWIGKIEIAAHGIALQLAATTFMFHLGISQAATILAGGALGRRNEADLRAIALSSYAVAFAFALIVVTIFISIPQTLISIFLDPNEPELAVLMALGVKLVHMAALFQVFDAGQVTTLALLRGVQDTKVPMWLAIIAYSLIGLPLGYVCAFKLGIGPVGIWIGLTAGLSVAFVLLGLRFWRRSVFIAPRPAVAAAA